MQYPSNLETNSISRPRLPKCDHNLTPPPHTEKKMNKKEKRWIVGNFKFRLDQVNNLHFRTIDVTGGRHWKTPKRLESILRQSFCQCYYRLLSKWEFRSLLCTKSFVPLKSYDYIAQFTLNSVGLFLNNLIPFAHFDDR